MGKILNFIGIFNKFEEFKMCKLCESFFEGARIIGTINH